MPAQLLWIVLSHFPVHNIRCTGKPSAPLERTWNSGLETTWNFWMWFLFDCDSCSWIAWDRFASFRGRIQRSPNIYFTYTYVSLPNLAFVLMLPSPEPTSTTIRRRLVTATRRGRSSLGRAWMSTAEKPTWTSSREIPTTSPSHRNGGSGAKRLALPSQDFILQFYPEFSLSF